MKKINLNWWLGLPPEGHVSPDRPAQPWSNPEPTGPAAPPSPLDRIASNTDFLRRMTLVDAFAPILALVIIYILIRLYIFPT